MHPKHYRIRMLIDIFRGFLLPGVVVSIAVSYIQTELAYHAAPYHALAILIWAGGRIFYSEMTQRREANRLGAVAIPRVAGNWPGNVDVLFRMMRSFKTSYLLNTYLDLFEEYQATTLNLRILWEDQASPISKRLFNSIQVDCLDNLDYIHGSGTLKIRFNHWIQSLLERQCSKRAHVRLLASPRYLECSENSPQGNISGKRNFQSR